MRAYPLVVVGHGDDGEGMAETQRGFAAVARPELGGGGEKGESGDGGRLEADGVVPGDGGLFGRVREVRQGPRPCMMARAEAGKPRSS